jgi:hypothetical protein
MASMERPLHHVFLLSYKRQRPDGKWEGQFIGVYSSLEQVEKAKERLRAQSSFHDYPQGFYVDCWRVDEDYDGQDFWAEEPPRPLI